MKKGRKRKLTQEDVQDIIRLYYRGCTPNGKGYSMSMLARMFKVSEGLIWKVVNHKYF